MIELDTSSNSIAISDFIPFTAFLLEYPVAYAPDAESSAASGFLSGVDLQVYTCTLTWHEDRNSMGVVTTHTLMQFSCPLSLVSHLGCISDRLQERFASRISNAGLDCEVHVTSRVERLDRVAL